MVAISISLISGFYHWWLPQVSGINPYSPLTLNTDSPSFVVDETFFYAPKAAFPQASLIELFSSETMALLAKISGSIPQAFILADLIFPALTFFVLYWLLNFWLKNYNQSVFTAVAILIFYHYFTYFPYLPSAIKLLINYYNSGSYWPLIRAFHPQISLWLFLLFVAALWKKLSWWKTGLLLSALTYSYFFYWTVAFTWLFWNQSGKKLLKIIILWAALTFPYWLSLLPLLPEKDYWLRNYFYLPPTGNQILLLVFGLVLSRRLNSAKLRRFWLSFYAGFSCLLAITMLLKFGADDPIGHWFLRVVNPLTAIILVLYFFQRFQTSRRLLTIATILLLLFQGRLHYRYFTANAEAFRIEPEKLEAFNYLKHVATTGSIVAAPSLADSLYLPGYTNSYAYLKHAQLRPADNQELLQRFLEVYKIADYDQARLKTMFNDNNVLIAKKRFDFDACAGHFLYFRLYNGADYYSCAVPEPVLEHILNQYQNTQAQLTYPADYWLGTESIDFGTLVWENVKYKIYALP